MMPFNPFSALTSKIFGGAAIALAIALGVVMWRADAISEQRDRYQRQAIETGLKLSVSNASIDLLQTKIADLNAEANKRADEYEAAKKLAAENAARLKEQAKDSDARIARLRELAGRPGTCEAPADLLSALEGL